MASDLKIEIFAYTIFYETWLQMNLVETKPDILQIYGEECLKVERINEAFDDLYIKPVTLRRKLFKDIYLEDFTDETAESLNSLTECYNYVVNKCESYDLFGELTVFEKMFATCVFVIEFCIRVHQYNVINVIEYGHVLWAMYFDKFTSEFYEEGGWLKLKVIAETYRELDFFCVLKNVSIFELEEAKENYFYFIFSGLRKKSQSKIHISKLWIKFRLERIDKYIRISLLDANLLEAGKVEELLEDLKEIFKIISEEKDVLSGIENSEIPSDYGENRTNINDDQRDEHFTGRKCETLNVTENQSTNKIHKMSVYKNPPPYNVPDTTSFHSKIPIGNSDTRTNTNDVKYFTERKRENQSTQEMHKISAYRKPPPYNVPDTTTLLIPTDNKTNTDDNLKSELFSKRKCEIPYASENNSTNEMHKISVYRKPPPYNVPNETFHSEILTSNADNRTNIGNDLRTEHFTERKCEIPNASEDQSTKEMHKISAYRKPPPYNVPDTTIFQTGISTDNQSNTHDNLKTEHDTERKCEIPNASEDQSTNEMHKISSFRKPPPYNVPDATIFHTGIPTDNQTNTDDNLKTEHFTERKCEIPNASENKSTNEMRKMPVCRKPPQYNVPDKTVFHSEIPTIHADKRTNIGNDLRSEHLTERKFEIPNSSDNQLPNKTHEILGYRKPPTYSFLDATPFNPENKSGIGSKEVNTKETLKMSSSSENEGNQEKTDNRMRSKTKSECSGNEDNINSLSVGGQYETANSRTFSSTKQMYKSLSLGPHSSEIPEKRTGILSANQTLQSQLEEDTSLEKETESVPEVLSRIQMCASECDGKTLLDILPIAKVLDPGNQFENTGNENEKGL